MPTFSTSSSRGAWCRYLTFSSPNYLTFSFSKYLTFSSPNYLTFLSPNYLFSSPNCLTLSSPNYLTFSSPNYLTFSSPNYLSFSSPTRSSLPRFTTCFKRFPICSHSSRRAQRRGSAMGSPTPGFPTDQLAETTLAPTPQKVFRLLFFPSWVTEAAGRSGKLLKKP